MPQPCNSSQVSLPGSDDSSDCSEWHAPDAVGLSFDLVILVIAMLNAHLGHRRRSYIQHQPMAMVCCAMCCRRVAV